MIAHPVVSKAAVLSVLDQFILEENELISDMDTKLAKLNDPRALIRGTDDKHVLTTAKSMAEQRKLELERKKFLVESVVAPRMVLEMEL